MKVDHTGQTISSSGTLRKTFCLNICFGHREADSFTSFDWGPIASQLFVPCDGKVTGT